MNCSAKFFFLFFCTDLDYTELEFIGSFQITNLRVIVTLTNSLTSKKTEFYFPNKPCHGYKLGVVEKIKWIFLMSV